MKILPITKIVSCLMFIAVMFPNFLAAQSSWSGTSLVGNSYRNGNVGIGQSSPSALLHIKSLERSGAGILPNLRLEAQTIGSLNYLWDMTSGSSLDFSSGTNTSNMTSRMTINSSTLHFKGNTTKLGLSENQLSLGSQNTPNGSLGQFIAFGANPLSGGYTFTGNSSNNGGSIITGDDKGNLFFITRGTNGSNTMTPAQTATNTKLFIKNDGNIGIGTSTPTAKLQISSGNISVDNGKVSIGTNALANHEQLAVRGGQITTEGIGNGISLNGSFTGAVNDFGTQRYGLFFGNGAAINLSTDQTTTTYNPIVLSSYYGLGFDVAFGKAALCQNGAFAVGTDNSFIEGIADIGTDDLEYSMYVEKGIRSERVRVDVKAKWPDYVFQENYELPNLKEVEIYIKKNNHLMNVPSEKEVKKKGLDLAETDGMLLRKIEELTLYTIEQQKQLEALKSQNDLLINRLEKLENQ